MSEKLGSLMREATASLHLVWEEPGSLRRRAGRRKVSRRAVVALVSVVALGAGGGIAFAPAAGPPRCSERPLIPSMPGPASGPADRLPNVLVAVSPPRLRVYHAAIGVAETVAVELRDRGFYVEEAARTDESVSYHSAVIRYGPGAEEDARVVRAQLIPDEVVMELDPAKSGPEVDLILGTRFTRLAPPC